jgi:hypothetical protein
LPNILGRDINFKRVIGKTKVRSQMLSMKTDDGRLVEREVPVLSSCAIDEDLCAGFLIDASNQYQDERSGIWYQIIDEKSTIPICLLNKSKYPVDNKTENQKDTTKKDPMKSLIDGIFYHSWTLSLATLDRQAAKDRQSTWLYASFGIASVICALLFATHIL